MKPSFAVRFGAFQNIPDYQAIHDYGRKMIFPSGMANLRGLVGFREGTIARWWFQ